MQVILFVVQTKTMTYVTPTVTYGGTDACFKNKNKKNVSARSRRFRLFWSWTPTGK